MRNKKILLVYYKLFRPGGVAKVTTNLANELLEQGYDVEILLLNREQPHFYPLDERIKVHNIDTFSHWAFRICEFNSKYLRFIPKIRNINTYIYHIGVFLMLKDWFNKNHKNYDTIISCWYKISKLISFLKGVREKTYAWEHAPHTTGGFFWKDLLKNRYKYLLGVIPTNKAGKVHYYGFNKNTILIYNMMDEHCENQSYIPENQKENIISVVARLDPEKNITEFLDIVKEINLPTHWTIKIIGNGRDEEMIHHKAKTENINVEFLGKGDIDAVYDLISKSKINCLTSVAEALPTILIQAMFHSNVLVAYDCNYGPADIISDKNGFLIPLHNKEMFKEKLNTLIANENLLNKLMKSSYEESSHWKKEKILSQWKEIL